MSLPPKGFWFRVIWQTAILAAVLTPLWQTWAMSCTLAVAWVEGRELVFLLRISWLLCPLGLDAVKKERLGEENGRATLSLAPKAKQDTAMAKRRLAFEGPVHFAALPE